MQIVGEAGTRGINNLDWTLVIWIDRTVVFSEFYLESNDAFLLLIFVNGALYVLIQWVSQLAEDRNPTEIRELQQEKEKNLMETLHNIR